MRGRCGGGGGNGDAHSSSVLTLLESNTKITRAQKNMAGLAWPPLGESSLERKPILVSRGF